MKLTSHGVRLGVVCALLLLAYWPEFSIAGEREFSWVNRQLTIWREHPREFMNQLPTKNGTLARPRGLDAEVLFLAKGRFRDDLRESQRRAAKATIFSPIQAVDRPEDLINAMPGPDGKMLPIYERLEEMELHGLTSGRVSQPWSDSYWPVYQGALAARYAAPEFPEPSKDWQEYKDVSSSAVSVDNLSPIEKYELLFGHTSGSLTRAMWNIGQYYQDEYGSVETWIGICHGWSYASYNLPRPRKSVVLRASRENGEPLSVVFYPSDIKALGSYLWSQGDLPYRFVGTRCSEKKPPQDANGRIDPDYPECVDSNPGTFHTALINELGLRRRSFVFDASFDYEVWNFPISAYSYGYFNPATGRLVSSLAKARVEVGFRGDKYAKYRSPLAKSVVGIALNMTYSAETKASHSSSDSSANDSTVTVHYIYDLELDDEGKIIGGEWYQNAHPDFLWTLAPQTEVVTRGDGIATGEWSSVAPPPKEWRQAVATSAKDNHLLPKAVKKIFELSQ